MSSKISIQIITYNGMKYLPTCLNSLRNQSFSDFSVLIIDNNSSDESVEFIKNNYPEFEIVENKENLGFAKAHNQGIEITQSDYILCLNQDMFLKNDFLQEVVEFLDENPQVGSLTGKIYRWDFDNNQATTQIDTAGLKLLKNYQVVDEGQGSDDCEKFSQAKEIFGVSGAAPIYRRSALQNVKINDEYFDEDFFMYKEDVDLAFRLNSAGWQAFFLPSAVAYHDRTISRNTSLLANRKQKSAFANKYSYRNHWLTLIKNIYLANFLRYFIFIFTYEFFKFVYILFFEPKTLFFALDFLKKSAKVWGKRKSILRLRKITASQRRRWIN